MLYGRIADFAIQELVDANGVESTPQIPAVATAHFPDYCRAPGCRIKKTPLHERIRDSECRKKCNGLSYKMLQ